MYKMARTNNITLSKLFMSYIYFLTCLISISESLHLRRPPTSITECKECHKQKLQAIGDGSNNNDPTDQQNSEGEVILPGSNRNSKTNNDVGKSSSESTNDSSSSKTVATTATSTTINKHGIDRNGKKQGATTATSTTTINKHGIDQNGKKQGKGGFGAFSLCKPWMSPDPCDIKPFKPINVYPPPSILESLPGVPISAPFTSLAKPLVIKSILGAIKLGGKERAAAQKNLDDKKIERDLVGKALEDASAEKIARIANGEPPPGLLSDESGKNDDPYDDPDDEEKDDKAPEEDPCPVDASGK